MSVPTTPSGLLVTEGLLLVRTEGTSMWPALRTGDLLFGHQLGAGERPLQGTVLVAEGPGGLMAHRLDRVRGQGLRERFYLAGDLSGPDVPLPRSDIRGVAAAIYRAGSGFLDIPPPLGLGPLGRRLVARLAWAWAWAQRRRSESRPQLLG